MPANGGPSNSLLTAGGVLIVLSAIYLSSGRPKGPATFTFEVCGLLGGVILVLIGMFLKRNQSR